MTDQAALYRLMAWLSPAYPVGAFSYSSGIEWAVEAGDIKDAGTLRDWLAVMLAEGAGFCDAVLFAQPHRAAAGENDRAGQRLRRGDARRLALRRARPVEGGLGRPGRLSGRGRRRRRRPRHRA